MSRTKAHIFLLLAGAVWGSGFIAQKTGLEHAGPMPFVAIRFTLATLFMAPLAYIEVRKAANGDKPLLARSDHIKFIFLGVLLFGANGAQQVGLKTTSVANSGFLTALAVVFVPMLAIIVFRQWPHPAIWPLAACSLLGVYLLTGGDLGQLNVGDAWTVLSSFFVGAQTLLVAHYLGDTDRPFALVTIQFAVTCVMAWVAVPILVISGLETFDSEILRAAPEILYTAIFSSVVAFTLKTLGQQHTSAENAGLLTASEAPFAAFFAFLVLDERITGIGVVGAAVIFATILIVQRVPDPTSSSPPPLAKKQIGVKS